MLCNNFIKCYLKLYLCYILKTRKSLVMQQRPSIDCYHIPMPKVAYQPMPIIVLPYFFGGFRNCLYLCDMIAKKSPYDFCPIMRSHAWTYLIYYKRDETNLAATDHLSPIAHHFFGQKWQCEGLYRGKPARLWGCLGSLALRLPRRPGGAQGL